MYVNADPHSFCLMANLGFNPVDVRCLKLTDFQW